MKIACFLVLAGLGDAAGPAPAPSAPVAASPRPAAAAPVVVTATDGYRVVFSLAETDPAFTDRVLLLADRKNGQPLSEKKGPFRIVAPSEKRPARWIRNIATIEIRTVE